MKLADRFGKHFTAPVPLLLSADTDAIKCEIKPYLQPFEEVLALRELKALVGNGGRVIEKYGYYLAYTTEPETLLQERLTYWQRVGKDVLTPTTQKALEFTQNGAREVLAGDSLHAARRLRYGPHDLHEYRGKFFPQLVRSLINISGVSDDGIVCDPMCGSGTTLCEALAAGRSAVGVDLNPLSVLISQVKASVVLESAEVFQSTVSKYLSSVEWEAVAKPGDVWPADDVNYLERWFDPSALKDLASILMALRRVRKPVYRRFFQVCLSNIVRSVSWQKEVDLRVRKEVRPYKRGEALARFLADVGEQVDRIYPYLSVLPLRSVQPKLDIRQGNAVDVASLLREYHGRVGVLITSPPYATALPYLDTDRLSLIVLGLLPRGEHRGVESHMVGTREVSEREREASWLAYLERRRELPRRVTKLIGEIAERNHEPDVGFRRRNLPALLGRYYLDMLDAMRSARKLMMPGAKGYYIVGNNSTSVDGERLEIPTDRFLYDIGESAGWEQEELITMELLASRDIFKENRGSAETILCFKA